MMKSALIVIAFSLLSFIATAQPFAPGDPGGDPDIPIDAGVGLLIAAGAAFGIKKVHDFSKKKK